MRAIDFSDILPPILAGAAFTPARKRRRWGLRADLEMLASEEIAIDYVNRTQ